MDVEKFYYARDHLGSVRELYGGYSDYSTETGRSVISYDYSPFGIRRRLQGDWQNETNFGYIGHYHHNLSQTVLPFYRGYRPDLGTWLSPDPLGEGVNTVGSLYNYVGNNTINFWDPLGLSQHGKNNQHTSDGTETKGSEKQDGKRKSRHSGNQKKPKKPSPPPPPP